MLILTRGMGETLVIGDDVTVTVLGVKGKRICIGVNAPKNVTVHRNEIYQRIQQQKQDIAEGASSGLSSDDQPPGSSMQISNT